VFLGVKIDLFLLLVALIRLHADFYFTWDFYFRLLMSTKIDIPKFDGKISFAIWQI
jgi:hypothetical protein